MLIEQGPMFARRGTRARCPTIGKRAVLAKDNRGNIYALRSALLRVASS